MAATARPDDVRSTLQALVRHFDSDVVENRRLIRELLASDREAFYSSALEILNHQCDTRGCQYLLTLFVAYDLLLRALCDPSTNKEQALNLARSAARVDSLTDVSLARLLAESSGTEEGPIPARHTGRLMEVLGEISDGTRILPSLMRMLRHPNPFLRSKTVKMIGRGSRSVPWVQNRLDESDPRIRANAIESLWGLDTDAARALLLTATRDSNNRVAGNAFVALYRLGDNTIIPDLLKMAQHESELFRSTAAWVMGESGDPRFSEVLAKLLCDSNPSVRTRVLAALGRIKAALAQSRQAEEWLVSAVLQTSDPPEAGRRLQIAVGSEEAHDCPRLLPTQFLISENGRQIAAYKVVERVVGEATVVFAVPREAVPGGSPWTRGIRACAPWKPPSDLWAVSHYLTGERGDAGGTSIEEPPHFTSSAAALEASLNQLPARTECADLWRTVWIAVRSDQGPSRGKRHLILFSQADPVRPPEDSLISAVRSSGTTVQVVATHRSAELEDFCRRAGASFQLAESPDAAARHLQMACLNLLARYEIHWQSPVTETTSIRLRVTTPEGWGEATVPMPSASEAS